MPTDVPSARPVLAHHLIMSMYGFWLPNDPRGSWSEAVRSFELQQYGAATKTSSRRSHARDPHNRRLRMAAKKSLKYPPVMLNGRQARAVARGFGEFVRKNGATVWACSILPDHVHLVVERRGYPIEQLATLLRGAATRQLVREQIHPLAAYVLRNGRFPKAFARGEWKVFLDSAADVRRAIRYVELNPIRAGLKPQRWSFVAPFLGFKVQGSVLPYGSRLSR